MPGWRAADIRNPLHYHRDRKSLAAILRHLIIPAAIWNEEVVS